MDNTYIKDDFDVICVGQMVVDCIIRNSQITTKMKNVNTADHISLNPGGDALNQATILTRLGRRVRLIGVTGPDYAGDLLRSVISFTNIDISGLRVQDDVITPVACLLVEKNGQRQSINSRATMLASYVPDPALIRGARILSLASLFRAPLDQASSVIPLVKEAKKQGMIVCADTKIPTFRKMALKDLSEILPMIDYFFPNENEAAMLTGGSQDPEIMSRILADTGIKNIIIKLGEKGCYLRSECGETFTVPPLKVNAVDSTGAGDNFVSGFLSFLLQGRDIHECAAYGTACAALCVENQGAVTGVKNAHAAYDKYLEYMNTWKKDG